MDKISSILPASPRITNVDMKNSGTARSGMPSYGRPQLEETGSARRHTQTNAMNEQLKQATKSHADIVDQLAKEFFIQKNQAPRSELTVDRAAIFGADSDLDPMTETERYGEEQDFAATALEPASENEDLDVPLAGGYLDVNV